MAIVGIDAVTYGVRDMEKGRRFYEDFGLRKLSSGKAGTVFEAQDGSQIVLKPMTSKDLPKPFQPGPGVREVTWGVSAAADLSRLKKELSKDRAVTEDRDGTLHTVDEAGIPIAFRRTTKRKLAKPGRTDINAPQAPSRVDARAIYYDRARPLTVGHIVFNVPDIKKQEAFYTKRVGFSVTDYYTGRGVFLRVARRAGHHSVFFLEDEGGDSAINHIGFGVRDIHEMFAGGLHFTGKGWKTAIGPGRHHVSSCYFWYFTNPSGGNSEYYCDEDYCTGKWKVGNWNPSPDTFAEWVLGNGLQRTKALPPTRTRKDAKAKAKAK
jgi:catechol 2,3-dioxygenase-like lactoylglutathione lyase family enzyme